jgi:hypothetical protein
MAGMELRELKIKVDEETELSLTPRQARELKNILDDLFSGITTTDAPIIWYPYQHWYPDYHYWREPIITVAGDTTADVTIIASTINN